MPVLNGYRLHIIQLCDPSIHIILQLGTTVLVYNTLCAPVIATEIQVEIMEGGTCLQCS